MKRLYWILLFCLVFIIALLILPYTPLSKPFLEKAVGAKIGGRVTIGQARLSWLGPQKFGYVNFTTPDLTGSVGTVLINSPLWHLKEPKEAAIENGTFTFPSYGDGSIEKVNGQMNGYKFELNGTTRFGEYTGYISLLGMVEANRQFDLAFDLKDFPVAALDKFLHGHRLIYEALGPKINLNGTANYILNQGTANIRFHSTNIQTEFFANLTEKGMSLRSPLDATIRLTPALSREIFSEVNPLFLSSAEAKKLILLHVDNNGFFLPYPFSIDQLQAIGTLDMGQVQITTGKSLASLLVLLKASPSKTMNAWFTPLDFRFHNGAVTTGRLDALLADSIHICTWGKIDLESGRIHMYLGLPADTLRRSFGIKGLSEKYVLKMPLRGTTKNPELETGPAAAKIASLIASQKLPIKKGLFGPLINTFTTIKEDTSVPEAQYPFPWDR